MSIHDLNFPINAAGLACWVACFIWMHRISKQQNEMLEDLREQGKRLEAVSKAEHELIKEVHPKVGQIQQNVEQVASSVEKLKA
jgi:hypothetical protein